MNVKSFQVSWLRVPILVGSVAAVTVSPSPGYAADDGELVDRVKRAVIQELRESGVLDQEIDQGIRRFIAQEQARAAQRQQGDADRRAAKVRPVSKERDHIFGNPDAEVSLIEYSDFECPFCKRFHATARQVVEAYGGRVNWVYRHFPLDFHNPVAQREAEATECAAELGGNEAFWKYSDLLFAGTRSNGQGLGKDRLVPLASNMGLDAQGFGKCLESGRHAARVEEDLKEGSAIGITGTPGNILRNNRTGAAQLRAGAIPLKNLKPVIDQMLNRSP